MKEQVLKPAYRVPLMTEIAAIPWNGFKVASTFSGCGGSCLGYRMAGFKVVWANEFVPAAQASYKANATDCILDPRDIRQVKSEEILAATGLKAGELDILDGSPPCQAFSTAGKRHKGWGKDKTYEHGAKQKNETLFQEYIRLLRGLMPRAFMAENVSGLVKGVAKGFFLEILRELKASGYQVQVKVLDAQWLGVPQCRQRVIFIGMRKDLPIEPEFPKPLPYRYSVRDALPWIGEVESLRAYLDRRGAFGNEGDCTNQPAPVVLAGSIGTHWIEHDEGGRYSAGNVTDCPAPTVRSGRAGTMFINQPSPCIQAGAGARTSSSFSHGTCTVPGTRRKFTIAELKRICGFPDDFVLLGSYAQQWERLGNSVPPVMAFHIAMAIRKQLERLNLSS